jgi:hypothetical protein
MMNRRTIRQAMMLAFLPAVFAAASGVVAPRSVRGEVLVSTKAPPPTPDELKLKDKWKAALTPALKELRAMNDQESVSFLEGILAGLDKPETTSTALKSMGDRVGERVRQLVKRGAMESAAILNFAQWKALNVPGPGLRGPDKPTHKSGGTPGPGGLVLYFSFDKQDDNGVVKDESGAGNDGKVTGAAWVAEGKFGGAYKFNIANITDRIVVANSDTLNVETVTLAAWIKTGEKDGFWNRVIDKDFRNGYCLDLGGDYNGKALRGKPQLESSRGSMMADRPLDDNQWHHVAGTYDGKVLCCYVDGIQKSRQTRNGGPLSKCDWDLCIGNSVVDYGTGEFLAFNGMIDEVRVYNRALSAGEIQSLAKATHAGPDPSATGTGETRPGNTTPKGDPAERMKKLKELLDQGLISKDEYDRKAKEILDSL